MTRDLPNEQRWRYLIQRLVDGLATLEEVLEFRAARAARLRKFASR